MSQVPAGIDAVWRRDSDGPPVAVGLALGIAGYGLFQEHNSELVTVGVYGAVLTLAGRAYFVAGEGRRLLVTWAVGAGLFGILILPVFRQLIEGAGEAANLLGNGSSTSTTGSTSWWALMLVVLDPKIEQDTSHQSANPRLCPGSIPRRGARR